EQGCQRRSGAETMPTPAVEQQCGPDASQRRDDHAAGEEVPGEHGQASHQQRIHWEKRDRALLSGSVGVAPLGDRPIPATVPPRPGVQKWMAFKTGPDTPGPHVERKVGDRKARDQEQRRSDRSEARYRGAQIPRRRLDAAAGIPHSKTPDSPRNQRNQRLPMSIVTYPND